MKTEFIRIGMIWPMLLIFVITSSCQKNNDTSDNNMQDNLPDISGYPIVETNQTKYFDNFTEISKPLSGSDFFGQDACYTGNTPQYIDNGDGTVTDMVTGLMWSQSTDLNGDGTINADDKLTYQEALDGASTFNLAGYTDWRLPTIKEMYSLILFSGIDVSGLTNYSDLVPFIDNTYFEFGYGDTDAGERIIDAQYASSTLYVDYTMDGLTTMFGVNFADGRIKGYGLAMENNEKTFYVAYVRGNTTYGTNNFTDNSDSTITDFATGLMWTKYDSEIGMLWKEALSYAEKSTIAGYNDWRLPNAKELQSIVDYSRSPSTTSSAAIDPVFFCTHIMNESGEDDYPWYWTGTTHQNYSLEDGGAAAYICFGRALGYMSLPLPEWYDVHGAGAQRSDYKYDNFANLNYVYNGYYFDQSPQGDAIRSYNFVRLVRDAD